VAARGSSVNRHQEGNGAGGQIRWAEVIVVDLVGPEITAVLWVGVGYSRDALSRRLGQNWVSAVWDRGG